MNRKITIELEQTIHRHGGHTGKPLWVPKSGGTTYWDYLTDSQCGIPLKSLKELRKEVGLT